MADAALVAPISIPPPRRMWSDAEWDTLRRGDRLVLSRGATGKNIYAVRFRRDLAGWRIISAEVESDPATYSPGDAQNESERLQSLIERLLA
jgi:hypothetical protein